MECKSAHTRSLKCIHHSGKRWEDMDSDVCRLDLSTICCRLFTIANNHNFSSLGKYSNYFNSYPLTSEDRKWVTGRKDVWYSSPNIVFTLSYTEDPMWIELYVKRQEALLSLPLYRHLWKINLYYSRCSLVKTSCKSNSASVNLQLLFSGRSPES